MTLKLYYMNSFPSLLSVIESKLADLSSKQSEVTSAYEYEKTFVDWWSALGKEVFQACLQEEQAANEPKKNVWPALAPSKLE